MYGITICLLLLQKLSLLTDDHIMYEYCLEPYDRDHSRTALTGSSVIRLKTTGLNQHR